MKCYLSIDIGGSAVKTAVMEENGHIVSKDSFNTPRDSYENLMQQLNNIIKWGKSQREIHGIALSLPLVMDSFTGEVLSQGPFSFISDKNIKKDLEVLSGLPATAENDGNCAALAEIWLGSAKDVQSMALVVSGTGIGGAVIQDRRIWHGKSNFSGEFGMTILGWDMEGEPYTWSDVGSTFGLVRSYADMKNIPVEEVNGRLVFDRMDEGEKEAGLCVDRFIRYFAQGIHNIQHVYDPELILIGGGVSEREDFISRINEVLFNLYREFKVIASKPLVKKCTFGADANLIGALYHYFSINKDKM